VPACVHANVCACIAMDLQLYSTAASVGSASAAHGTQLRFASGTWRRCEPDRCLPAFVLTFVRVLPWICSRFRSLYSTAASISRAAPSVFSLPVRGVTAGLYGALPACVLNFVSAGGWLCRQKRRVISRRMAPDAKFCRTYFAHVPVRCVTAGRYGACECDC